MMLLMLTRSPSLSARIMTWNYVQAEIASIETSFQLEQLIALFLARVDRGKEKNLGNSIAVTDRAES